MRRAAGAVTDLGVAMRIAAALAGPLVAFLRRPITLPEACAELARRLARREQDFLALVREAVYANPASVYRRLLHHVACQYGDLERLVAEHGLEAALRRLLREGVVLTVDEAKGRRPVVRGSLTVPGGPAALANPLAARHVPVASSGSRGPRTTILMDLAFIRDHGVNTGLAVDAGGGAAWVKAAWEVPGGAALYRILKLSSFGTRVARWFTQVDPTHPALPPRYRWIHRLVRAASVAAGVPLPGPVHAPLDDPLPVVRWMADVVRRGSTPWVRTFPSSAVRACQAALAAGLDLTGVRFTVSGEPVTAAKLEAIRRRGARATPRYGSMEAGPLAWGCLAPQGPDDMHVFHDLHAVVQPEGNATLFLTSLRRATPLVMLNVSMGDEATLGPRACGCPLEALGWPTHLQGVVSREKLTAAGMTFHDVDVVHVLERVLADRLGGGPTDYQLLEDESETGEPRVRLLVHPRVGPLDPGRVAAAFLAAIGEGSGPARVMGRVWRDAAVVQWSTAHPCPPRPGRSCTST